MLALIYQHHGSVMGTIGANFSHSQEGARAHGPWSWWTSSWIKINGVLYIYIFQLSLLEYIIYIYIYILEYSYSNGNFIGILLYIRMKLKYQWSIGILYRIYYIVRYYTIIGIRRGFQHVLTQSPSENPHSMSMSRAFVKQRGQRHFMNFRARSKSLKSFKACIGSMWGSNFSMGMDQYLWKYHF